MQVRNDQDTAYAVRLRRVAEAFAVEATSGTVLAYVYFAEGARLAATNRLSEPEALAVARRIARALSE